MARVNFREIRGRFTHIDAAFVSCVISIPGESHYAVRFYPYWEHPVYAELRNYGSWKWDWPDRAEKVVTVYPINLIQASVKFTGAGSDWRFVDSPDPLLWRYEREVQVLCKNALPSGSLLRLSSMIAAELPYHADVRSLSSLLYPLGWEDPGLAESRLGGFSLGRFPESVHVAVRSVLDQLGVEYVPEEAAGPTRTLPVMLVIDGEDYLIADDFDVEVPIFEHEAGWVKVTKG